MAGYGARKSDVLVQLNRIEGQIRGLQRMVEADTYCIDVLTQISAASAGLRKASLMLLGDHIEHCVVEEASPEERLAKVDEATAAIGRLLKA
jgi:CsoR family transcriptional regulator, copper-sensing transcriptional repressor